MSKTKSQFERSEETARIIAYLKPLEKGQRVTYQELSRQIGIRIDAKTPKLISARHILIRDHNAVWIAVRPGVGLQRLTDAEIADRIPAWWLKGARSKLSRGEDQAEVVETKQLDIDQQTKFAVDSIQLHLAMDSLSKATRRKLEKVSRGTSNDLPSFSAIEWAISLSPKGKR